MSRRSKATIILAISLCLVLGVIFYIMLEPSRWSREIISYLNDNILKDNGWKISVESVNGQLTSDVYLNDVMLEKNDGSIIFRCKKSKINLDYSQLLTGNWAISQLSCENSSIIINLKGNESVQKLLFVEKLVQKGFNIRELNLDMIFLNIYEEKGERAYTFNTVSGEVYCRDGSLVFSPTKLQITDHQNNLAKINVDDGEIILNTTTIATDKLEGTFNQIRFALNTDVTFFPQTELGVDLTVFRITPDTYLPGSVTDFFNTKEVDIRLQLNSDLTTADVQTLIRDSNTSDQLFETSLFLKKEKKNIYFSQGEINIGSSKLLGEGSLLGSGELALNLKLKNLDLGEVGLIPNHTDIHGVIELNGTVELGKINEFISVIELQNEEVESDRYVKANGTIIYKDNVLTIPDSLLVSFKSSSLIANGWINLTKERMNVYLESKKIDLYSLGSIVGLDSLNGIVAGELKVEGYARDPLIRGDNITIRDGKFHDTAISRTNISFRLNSVISDRDGWLNVSANDGKIFDRDFKTGELNVSFQGDTVFVSNARLINDDGDYLQLSGKIVEDQSLYIDQMQLFLKEQFFTNVGQIALHRLPDGLTLDPVSFRMGTGTARFSFTYQDGQLKEGDFDLLNIDLASFWSILDMDVNIVGTALADFSASTVNNQLELQADIEVKDGLWGEIEFNNLLFDCYLENDQLYIKEFRFRAPNNVSLNLSGFCGIQLDKGSNLIKLNREGEIGFSSEFKKFEVGLVSGYVIEDWQLGGAATGSMAMMGTASSPEITFHFSVDKPWLELIHGENISGSGRYTDQRLFFEDLIGKTKTGYYTGEGYLPVDLALVPEEEDRFIEYDPISMNFKVKTSSLDFLTPYFEEVDSVKGDIDIELTIEGTPMAPIRNGKFEIKDGQIYALLLDLPIDQVNGSARLENNKFIITDFTALNQIPKNLDWREQLKGILFKKSEEKIPYNLKVTGVMDMETFFNPDLAFHIYGDDVYLRTLLGEIEGIVDLDLVVTGQDTLNINGDIIPEEVVLRMEFGGESYEDVEPEKGRISRYRLFIPIDGNVFIQNSQIDAELEGDMSLFRVGNEPFHYSGELDLLYGKFYYYSDVFYIQRGHLIFDPSEFNPKIDIEATTKIEGINILVSLTGDFEEPIVNIEDSEQYYSHGELLELLTIRKHPEEFSSTSELLGTKSVNLIGRYLESEFEKSLVRATPLLNEFEILDEFDRDDSGSLLSRTGSEESGRSTEGAVKAGTRLSSNLYLSYKQSFSLSESQVGIEYRVNRNLSLVVTYDENGEMHLTYRRKYKF